MTLAPRVSRTRAGGLPAVTGRSQLMHQRSATTKHPKHLTALGTASLHVRMVAEGPQSTRMNDFSHYNNHNPTKHYANRPGIHLQSCRLPPAGHSEPQPHPNPAAEATAGRSRLQPSLAGHSPPRLAAASRGQPQPAGAMTMAWPGRGRWPRTGRDAARAYEPEMTWK